MTRAPFCWTRRRRRPNHHHHRFRGRRRRPLVVVVVPATSLCILKKSAQTKRVLCKAKEEVFLSRLETNGFVVVCRRERFLRATTRGRNTPTCTGPSSALFSRRHHERNAKDERATTSIRRSLRTTKRWW